jgi:hypothetical protein
MSRQWIRIATLAVMLMTSATVLFETQLSQTTGDTHAWNGELASLDTTPMLERPLQR